MRKSQIFNEALAFNDHLLSTVGHEVISICEARSPSTFEFSFTHGQSNDASDSCIVAYLAINWVYLAYWRSAANTRGRWLPLCVAFVDLHLQALTGLPKED